MSQTASKTVHTTKSYSIWNIRSLTIMALMTALLIVSKYRFPFQQPVLQPRL